MSEKREECPGPDNCVESKTSNGCLGCHLEKKEHKPRVTVDCHRCPIMRVCQVRNIRASLNLERYEGHFFPSISEYQKIETKLKEDYEKMREVTARCPLARLV